jgi:hypothetical protein
VYEMYVPREIREPKRHSRLNDSEVQEKLKARERQHGIPSSFSFSFLDSRDDEANMEYGSVTMPKHAYITYGYLHYSIDRVTERLTDTKPPSARLRKFISTP